MPIFAISPGLIDENKVYICFQKVVGSISLNFDTCHWLKLLGTAWYQSMLLELVQSGLELMANRQDLFL